MFYIHTDNINFNYLFFIVSQIHFYMLNTLGDDWRSRCYHCVTGPIVIRTEEAFIVICVMILWVAAIALFFNRWGKIRMLEPYQPKFHEEEHRPSCPMVELASASGIGHSITGGVSFEFFFFSVIYLYSYKQQRRISNLPFRVVKI